MTSEERAKQFLDQAEPTLYAYGLFLDQAEPTLHAYDLEFLTSQFEEHAAEQREACADAANSALADLNLLPSEKAIVILAVAKAQEKGDE